MHINFYKSDLRILSAENIQEISELKTLKHNNIFHVTDKIGFQGYRCKSDIAIFEEREGWNHAYSPCMRTNLIKVNTRISLYRQW